MKSKKYIKDLMIVSSMLKRWRMVIHVDFHTSTGQLRVNGEPFNEWLDIMVTVMRMVEIFEKDMRGERYDERTARTAERLSQRRYPRNLDTRQQRVHPGHRRGIKDANDQAGGAGGGPQEWEEIHDDNQIPYHPEGQEGDRS